MPQPAKVDDGDHEGYVMAISKRYTVVLVVDRMRLKPSKVSCQQFYLPCDKVIVTEYETTQWNASDLKGIKSC